jgi:hypothetical protein
LQKAAVVAARTGEHEPRRSSDEQCTEQALSGHGTAHGVVVEVSPTKVVSDVGCDGLGAKLDDEPIRYSTDEPIKVGTQDRIRFNPSAGAGSNQTTNSYFVDIAADEHGDCNASHRSTPQRRFHKIGKFPPRSQRVSGAGSRT